MLLFKIKHLLIKKQVPYLTCFYSQMIIPHQTLKIKICDTKMRFATKACACPLQVGAAS
jgi:hypothetical protein